MAKRFCDTGIWDKDWFMDLSCRHKCLIRFIFDRCDVAGIWEPNWRVASMHVGEKCTDNDLNVFGDQILRLPNGKIFVTGFLDFQYGTLSEKCNPHVKVISILKKQNLFEGYLKGTLKGTPRVKEEDKDKEEEVDKEEDKEEGVENEVLIWPSFKDFWELYDKKVGDKEKLAIKWSKISQRDKETVMQHVYSYKVSQPDKKFRKDPATYLNNRSWNDEIIGGTPQSEPQVNGRSSLTNQYMEEFLENE